VVSRQHHFYGVNHLRYLNKSTYRRVRVFDSGRFELNFTKTLDHLRAELAFKIIGYVLMTEHFHLLVWPSRLANPSQGPAGGDLKRMVCASRPPGVAVGRLRHEHLE
jgi:REP element-mobilizing transposase RayT